MDPRCSFLLQGLSVIEVYFQFLDPQVSAWDYSTEIINRDHYAQNKETLVPGNFYIYFL